MMIMDVMGTGLLMYCSGGLELLFNNERKHVVTVPAKDGDGKPVDVAFLVRHLCDNLMKDPRREMFVLDGTVLVSRQTSISPILMNWFIDGLAFLFSSMMQTGSSRGKTSTSR